MRVCVILLLLKILPAKSYDCGQFQNDPMGQYLNVKSMSDLPRPYKNVIDQNYYKKLALSQPCLQTDPAVKIPIVGSSDVDSNAISSASSILSMLNASSIFMNRMMSENAYIALVPRGKSICDLPETTGMYCDSNWGGMNLRKSNSIVIMVRTECVLCEQMNGYAQHGGILIHEFTHGIEFANRLQSWSYHAYLTAYWRKLWKGTYIDKGPIEYLPVGAEIYFGLPLNVAYEWPVRNRDQLKTYDPNMYALLRQIFGDYPLIYGPRICVYKCD